MNAKRKTLADLAQDDGVRSSTDGHQIGKPERPGIEARPESVTVIGKPGENLTLGDIDDLLRTRGLNPDDWQIKGAVVNEWEANAVIEHQWVKATNHQLKVTLVPKPHIILPVAARTDGPKYKLAPQPKYGEPELIAILPDQQAPYQDERLHDLVLAWLEANRPHRIICSGDLTDLPTISRHPPKAHERETSVKQGIDVSYKLLRQYVQAAGDRCWKRDLVPGNHEHRFQKAVLEMFPALYGISRADSEKSVLSLPYLLRLDELGFEWATDPVYNEDYPAGHVVLGSNLAVYHGWIAKANAGATALATLRHLGHSVIVGHTHRQAYTPHTYHEIGGALRVLGGWEAGTLARVRGGLGYTVAPDWQPGFLTAWLYPDDMFDVSHAKYVNGVLMWNGQRYGKELAA